MEHRTVFDRARSRRPAFLAALICCLLSSACSDFFSTRGLSPSRPTSAIPAPSAPVRVKSVEPPSTAYTSACLVLLLPESGPFAPFAEKIRAGAAAARQETAQSGFIVDVRVVNTAQPDWPARLEALPSQCAVAGGPLRTQDYAKAREVGAVDRRNFFAFLPQLNPGDEGRIAWRFFPGPMDQISALLRFARQDLGIASYGAFYPADAYGARMAGLFEQAVASGGGGAARMVSYPPGNMLQWPDAAARLVQPRMVGKIPLPAVPAGAVFLPDSWKNMDMVTTSLLYNGEDRQVLLGAGAWEQSLSTASMINAYNYQLAVFPGAWDPLRAPPGLLQVLPGSDFWAALGYDFVRFGAALGARSRMTPEALNERIRSAQNMLWAMAPMQWDAQGRSSQNLYLFTPTSTGAAPLDVAAFKERRARILNRFEQRTRAAAAAAKGR